MTDSFRPTSFRAKAREALKGKWGMGAIATLLYMIIGCTGLGITIFIPIAGPIAGIILFLLPLAMGLCFIFLDVSNGAEVEIKTMFEPFSNYGRYIGGGALVFLYTFLWCLLLYVPGIIKSYSYSQTFYLMRENPELSGEEAIQLSMKMMHGHKAELFWLDLSFIGWVLLGYITFCIGILWVVPYMQTARAEFYKELKKEWEVRQALNAA